MTGNNSLRLNCATMKQAMQDWLDRNLTNKEQLVDDVTWDAGSHVFVVKFASVDKDAETP